MSDLLRRVRSLPPLLLAARAGLYPGAADHPPIVFAHGNGDTAPYVSHAILF